MMFSIRKYFIWIVIFSFVGVQNVGYAAQDISPEVQVKIQEMVGESERYVEALKESDPAEYEKIQGYVKIAQDFKTEIQELSVEDLTQKAIELTRFVYSPTEGCVEPENKEQCKIKTLKYAMARASAEEHPGVSTEIYNRLFAPGQDLYGQNAEVQFDAISPGDKLFYGGVLFAIIGTIIFNKAAVIHKNRADFLIASVVIYVVSAGMILFSAAPVIR